MKRLAIGMAATLATAVPALAQMSLGGGKEASPVQQEYERQVRDREEIERRYKATVKHTTRGASDTSNDPWANVRALEKGGKPR
jgi:hypothetical protein